MNGNELLSKAKEAREHAYVPYSQFPVGAAILMENGEVFLGANIENASYGLTNCAERTALFKAYSEGNNKVQKIAIIADTKQPIAPCGACRQVMVELCPPHTKVILSNLNGQVLHVTVGELLPGAFTAEDINDKS